MCNMNCLQCEHKDCINDRITDAERAAQNKFDKELMRERIPEERQKKGKLAVYDHEHTDKRKESRRRYIQSEKGKGAQQRYNQSEKGKESRSRYYQTEKGKETQRKYARSEKGKATAARKTQKKIASGKNAEACRRYREKKKAEREAALCKA